jgi:hypothetical protein
VRRADNLTTFMCQLSRNLGASTSWNPQGLSRPVMGLLFYVEIKVTFSVSNRGGGGHTNKSSSEGDGAKNKKKKFEKH